MSDIAISVENVSKMYRLGEVGTGTISHDLNRWVHRIRGKEDPYLKLGEENKRDTTGGGDYVWALKDVSFEVEQGQVLGIIGKNGAGKSTLLKLLSRVTAPTTGLIKAKGRIASLLEVGTGFHPELTGRENIFLNGAILGMTKPEIRSKFDEIVDFSGVARYVDTPVKRYSSGMYVRLAFAVAAFLEPEILIVDEVLAVGDAEFQKKCLGRMKDVSQNDGRTVLFVSHNMGAIKNLCHKTLVMKHGTVDTLVDTPSAIERYLSSDSDIDRCVKWVSDERPGDNTVRLNSIKVLDKTGDLDKTLTTDDDILVEIDYEVLDMVKDLRITVSLMGFDGEHIFSTSDFNYYNTSRVREKGTYSSTLKIPSKLLNLSRYYVSVNVEIPSVKSIVQAEIVSFNVEELIYNEMGVLLAIKPPGQIHPVLNWDVKKLN
jgi:lipopolysaccharide transport system ATP-binding protein